MDEVHNNIAFRLNFPVTDVKFSDGYCEQIQQEKL